jgi:hypothetical protein
METERTLRIEKWPAAFETPPGVLPRQPAGFSYNLI